MTTVSLLFSSLFVVSAVSSILSDNISISLLDYRNDNSTNSTINDNSTMLDLSKGRSVISGNINISTLPEEIHSVWIVDGGNWQGYSPSQDIRDEIEEKYTLLDHNIPAYKATLVFALEDTQLGLMENKNPTDVTRVYANNLSLHGTNGLYLSVDDIRCQENYHLASSIKLMGDTAFVFAPDREVSNYETFTDIYETDGYFVFCKQDINDETENEEK